MTQELIERSNKRRAFADVALVMTTVALVLSLAVAVTTVSIGIARADTLDRLAGGNSGRVAIALFLAFVFAGMGGLTAIAARDGTRRDQTPTV